MKQNTFFENCTLWELNLILKFILLIRLGIGIVYEYFNMYWLVFLSTRSSFIYLAQINHGQSIKK